MGSNWSKLKKAVEKGEESRALELYTKNSDMRRKLNANSVVNDYTLDTYMHVAARHGMREFLKLLLYENGGNPNKLNRRKQTVLHRVCEGHADSVQYECMQLLLQWHDPTSSASQLMLAASAGQNHHHNHHNHRHAQNSNSTSHKPSLSVHQNDPNMANNLVQNSLLVDINVNAKDDADNTPLHYAAKNNLATCVQTLVAHGAYLFVENAEHSTPCDLAEKNGHKDIALYLESKMIFSKDDDEKENAEDEQEVAVFEEKQNYGLRIQDLQEEKDKLLLETADMLRCSMFTAEILLKKHAWSKQNLLNAWIEDPIKCCEKCGISTETLNLINPTTNGNNGSSSKSPPLNGGTATYRTDTSTNKIRPLELDSNSVIARKLSGRYMTKKKGSENSLQQQVNNGGRASDSESLLSKTNNNKEVGEDNGGLQLINCESDEAPPPPVNENLCSICLAIEYDASNEEQFFRNNCAHRFCRACWDNYLTTKIDEGAVNDIVCPQVDCFAIIPPQVVESLISKETAQRYLHFDLKAFVESNPTIKWCPFPGCGMAVKNPKLLNPTQRAAIEQVPDFLLDGTHPPTPPATTSSATTATTSSSSTVAAKSSTSSSQQSPLQLPLMTSNMSSNQASTSTTNMSASLDYSLSVDCGNGHYFCWECLQEGHEPASCSSWRAWFQKIAEIKPEELCQSKSARTEESSANTLWLVTHSKRCPNANCQAPIQKHEGCNHVKCYRCKHDFCWICLEPWKKHSSATGGYFQCNRYEASSKILQKEKVTVAEAEEAHLKAVELNKFVHYYTRFKNHEHSYKIEEPLLAMAKQKFEILTAAQQQQQNSTSQLPVTNELQNSPTANPHVSNSSVTRRNSSISAASTVTPPSTSKFAALKQKMVEKSISSTETSKEKQSATSKQLEKQQGKEEKSSTATAEAINNSIEELKSSSHENLIALESSKQQKESDAIGLSVGGSSSVGGESSNNSGASDLTNGVAANAAQVAASTPKVPPHQFIEDAIRELLKARRILRCSYVYGYYLETTSYGPHKKFIFEFVQTEFEECTENLSQCIARPHLKTPKSRIIRLTNMLRRKRVEFIETITRGLNTFNDTPPTLKKYSRQRWKYLLKDNIQNDDEFKNTIALSLKELNPKNPWIIDKKGRHTNLLALLDDWPELERDLESILVSSKDMTGLCARWDCGNVRAVNTLSGSLCNYCSIRCMRLDHNSYMESKKAATNASSSSSSASPSSTVLSALAATTNTNHRSSVTKLQKSASSATNYSRDSSTTTQKYPLNGPIELVNLNKPSNVARTSKEENETNSEFFEAIRLSLIDEMRKKEKSGDDQSESKSTSEKESKLVIDEPLPATLTEHLTVIPFEPFYLSASSDKDLSLILKNLKSVVYNHMSPEQLCERKVHKVCDFGLNDNNKKS